MTDHPITPPPELIEKWHSTSPLDRSVTVATQAARWGADQELKACCDWMSNRSSLTEQLRSARRPKPPSPKEEALQVLESLIESRRIVDPEYQALRHALEQIND